jgi:hypothetical protein
MVRLDTHKRMIKGRGNFDGKAKPVMVLAHEKRKADKNE